MAAVPSTMLALGTKAPDFKLPDVVTGKRISLKDFSGKRGLLVMFISRHCPYVQHVKNELSNLAKEYDGKVGIVAIGANDVANYPDDAPDRLKAMAAEQGWKFPVCFDESQAVAQAFTAACTPDFFLFDSKFKLAYRGQLDDSRPGNDKPVTGRDLRDALNAVVEGKPANPEQRPSIGCNIKWKPGNEPAYFTQR